MVRCMKYDCVNVKRVFHEFNRMASNVKTEKHTRKQQRFGCRTLFWVCQVCDCGVCSFCRYSNVECEHVKCLYEFERVQKYVQRISCMCACDCAIRFFLIFFRLGEFADLFCCFLAQMNAIFGARQFCGYSAKPIRILDFIGEGQFFNRLSSPLRYRTAHTFTSFRLHLRDVCGEPATDSFRLKSNSLTSRFGIME